MIRSFLSISVVLLWSLAAAQPRPMLTIAGIEQRSAGIVAAYATGGCDNLPHNPEHVINDADDMLSNLSRHQRVADVTGTLAVASIDSAIRRLDQARFDALIILGVCDMRNDNSRGKLLTLGWVHIDRALRIFEDRGSSLRDISRLSLINEVFAEQARLIGGALP